MRKRKSISLDRESFLILVIVCIGVLVTLSWVLSTTSQLSSSGSSFSRKLQSKGEKVSSANVPLATGQESTQELFIQSGCPVCHTIPGIKGAKGREGPTLLLGATARQRLSDPSYRGIATTEWEYIQESILSPGAYIVPGYRDRVMPQWYGKKLSAGALDKMIKYLLPITESFETWEPSGARDPGSTGADPQ